MLNPDQFPKISVPYDKLLARLGYARGKTTLDPKITEMLHEEIAFSSKLISAKQVISSSKVLVTHPDVIKLEPGLTINSIKIFGLLKDCSIAYGFAVTIGPGLEENRDRLIKEKETTRALILDAIGSVMAEELADITNNQIKNEASKLGLTTTMRFSPGYGDWDLPGQKDFLAWLGAANIGIKLNNSSQMAPEKSVSAIIGLK